MGKSALERDRSAPHGELTIGQDICFKQFYSMCVSGNGRGENSRVYGRKKCQRWSIVNH